MSKINFVGGAAGLIGGILGVILAPIMVMIKYLTGWSIIPKPFWIDIVSPSLDPLLSFATPPGLWMVYGGVYTISLLLMLAV